MLLDRLAGARIRLITPADYARAHACMMQRAPSEVAPSSYVIPEGGSNGLGALGYVEAMREVRGRSISGSRRDAVRRRRPRVRLGWHGGGRRARACAPRPAKRALAIAVCDDAAYFERAIAAVVSEARELSKLPEPAPLVVDDRSKGPRYAVMSAEQRAFLVQVARESGVVLDPVYTGKAMFGLARFDRGGDVARGARVLFLHTGGLPGLLADGDVFFEELA